MDNYQYRLLQLSIPTRTTRKEQEEFLREIFDKHIPMLIYSGNEQVPVASNNALMLFKEAYVMYNIELPDYMSASVLARATARGLYDSFY